ncbi:MAG TPA: efflux transporter outer membrane subunit, partial [Candidatus Binatia bacterium]|nr:efflux transporter outer membrane subunit [Candidatus Binatia bacterium]
RGLLVFALAGFTSGCMVGPDYQQPQVDVPQTWRVEDKNAQAVTNTAWWEEYNDPVLNELVQSALQENKDVKIAAARIEQFLGLYTTTRAALFPQVGGSTSAGRQRGSKIVGSPSSDSGGTFNNFEVFLSANWELDLWGKLRRATESARATLLSTEAAHRSVILTLVAGVANSYINLRNLDKQLEVTRQTAKSYRDAYDLFQLRFDYGVVSQLELSQAKAQYEQAVANIPVFQKAIAQEENALSVLLGRNPGPILRGKTLDEMVLPSVPEYLPSEVLVNRPDIRQAEENLVAANADIGVAKAQYFPSIFLTGSFGAASSDLSTLFTVPGRIWSVAAPLTVPIFTAGAIAGQVKTAEALQEEALFRYQQVIQIAFREVDDALVDQERTREELASLTQQVETLREYVTLARLRYEEGYASYLEVTYAENLLYEAQVRRIAVQGGVFQAFANLYRAMGVGG